MPYPEVTSVWATIQMLSRGGAHPSAERRHQSGPSDGTGRRGNRLYAKDKAMLAGRTAIAAILWSIPLKIHKCTG
jgi:hypothetical protein